MTARRRPTKLNHNFILTATMMIVSLVIISNNIFTVYYYYYYFCIANHAMLTWARRRKSTGFPLELFVFVGLDFVVSKKVLKINNTTHARRVTPWRGHGEERQLSGSCSSKFIRLFRKLAVVGDAGIIYEQYLYTFRWIRWIILISFAVPTLLTLHLFLSSSSSSSPLSLSGRHAPAASTYVYTNTHTAGTFSNIFSGEGEVPRF